MRRYGNIKENVKEENARRVLIRSGSLSAYCARPFLTRERFCSSAFICASFGAIASCNHRRICCRQGARSCEICCSEAAGDQALYCWCQPIGTTRS